MSKNACWVVGYHAINALLATQPQRALELWVVLNPKNSNQSILIEKLRTLGLSVQTIDKQALAKRVGNEKHQGVALLATAREATTEKQLLAMVERDLLKGEPPLLLVLDQVQDPHNFGACLRCADAAGVDAVIIAKDNTSPITAVVQKVASGAAETLEIVKVTNLVRCMQALQQLGVWFIGTSDKALDSLYQQDLSGPIAIVMGGEGKGMRALTAKTCDQLVSLPMAGAVVSSLNVSVATGVCLFEAVRQRA